MKFNVGDKFISENEMSLLSNTYHWDKALWIHEVAQANDHYFTYSDDLNIDGGNCRHESLFSWIPGNRAKT